MKKEKYHIEYLFGKISTNSLWQKLSTPFGLSEWFADDVTKDDDLLTFYWNGTTHRAYIVFRRETSVRFRWEDAPTTTFFEFDVKFNDLMGATSLKVTDFAEPDEKEDAIMLWNTQIDELRRIIGA